MNFQEAVNAVLQDKVATRRAWLNRGDDDLCLRLTQHHIAGKGAELCGWIKAGTRGVLTEEDKSATDWLVVDKYATDWPAVDEGRQR